MLIERHGSGPVHLLGIHGWSGDSHTFDALLPDLPGDVTFWTVNLPGYGGSPRPAKWKLSRIVDELVEALIALPEPVHIAGQCSGSLFALEAANRPAIRNSGKISKITMIDAFAYWPWYFGLFLAPVFGPVAYFSSLANPMGRWITNASLAGRRKSTTDLTSGFGRVNHYTTYRYLGMLSEIQNPESFRGIQSPVYILYGERSFGAVKHSVRRWQQVFPGSEVTMLRGAGHMPILEATDQVRSILFGEIPCPAQASQSTNSVR